MTAVQSPAPRHLARISQAEKLKAKGPHDYVYDPSGGNGVDVYVFDTGINRHHKSLGNRASFGIDFTGEGPGDANGHGTFIAGLIGSTTHGVAKKANLVDIKVVKADGRGRLSWVLRGIDYVIRAKRMTNRPAVINMSFATIRNNVFNRAIQNIINMDIPVVASAGNQNVSACKYSPASVPDVLVIGSFDDRTESLAPFTNWGLCVDAFAPGVNVDSLDAHTDGTVTFSGTSVSSAIGSGLVAYFMGMGDTGALSVERVSRY